VNDSVKNAVRTKYAQLARQALSGSTCSCCSSPDFSCTAYTAAETAGLPAGLAQSSLGCGNPTALAGLRPGEVVLDLGSGAGLDVLLAAQRVGPEGKVYGLDMTDEMLELARRNQRASGISNVEFMKGEMENIPLPDNHIDVIMSNCVINLAVDKAVVLKEAYRVLKPGGRLAISDMVWRREVPHWLREQVELWAGCVAGALTEAEYRRLLEEAGFTDVKLKVTHVFSEADLPVGQLSKETAERLAPYAGSLVSAFVQARARGQV